MYRKLLLAVFLFILNVSQSFSETFVVTSKEDSGAGTLRDALQKAELNGTAQTDYINFNLPGDGSDLNNRTIRLRSQLPRVSSRVIIDGSTQSNWAKLGVSGARIIIEPEFTPANFSGLIIGSYLSGTYTETADIEIYGLFIRNFANIVNLQTINNSQGSGIVIDYRVNNVTIGTPGKGNVIAGNVNGIVIRNTSYYTNNPDLANIKIQSNLIGVMDNGTSPRSNFNGIIADLYDTNLNIGGDQSDEGNTIAANAINIQINRSNGFTNLTRPSVNIIKNNIGTNYDGTIDYKALPIFNQSSSIEMYGIRVNGQIDINILKNIISGQRSWAISISNASFLITENKIGTGSLDTKNLSNNGGISIATNAQGTIGGTADADANIIGYNRFGIETTSSFPIKITRNSMFCNEVFAIGKASVAQQAYIQVLKIRTDHISGKASPNSEVELFYIDENCTLGKCQGKTYFATVRAGNDGRWSYDGMLNGKVTATASLPTAVTSPFSTGGLLINEAVVTPVTCKGDGSITISEEREGITFNWYKIENDGSAGFLSNNQSIADLSVGTYELKISDGCSEITHQFSITDQKLTKPIVNAPVPVCGQVIFSFAATTLRGKGTIRYDWVDNTGAVVKSGQNVSMPEGTYRARVTDDAGCVEFSDPVTIVKRPTPVINTGNMKATAAACGFSDGSIKGIVVTPGVGTVTYKWFTYNNLTGQQGTTVVSEALDLENVESGYYILQVTDQGDCSPVKSNPLFISIYNSVKISGGIITPVTCNKTVGAISNITITEANTFEWFGPNNQSILTGPYSSGMTLELKDQAPGTYRLVAKNNITGCESSMSFIINQIPPQVYSLTPSRNAATCGLNNGSITLNYTSAFPIRFEWRNESGDLLSGTNKELKDLAPGQYTFYAYDINNCETVFGPYNIEDTPLLKIVPASAKVIDDGCTLKRGSVIGIEVIGGVPAYNYKWINEAGEAVQYTRDLINVGAGKYRLVATDRTSCGTFTSEEYTVNDYPFPLAAPVINDMRVCYATEIMLKVIGPEEGTYQLFKDTLANPILESDNGTILFKVAKSGDYLLRRKLGSCVSDFSPWHIEVTNDNLDIMNTMSPNGDYKNDRWTIMGLPENTDILIQIYSREGQLVYESIGSYDKPFDGTFRGKELPAGVYYYKIDLRADCVPLAGSLTLLR
ncbi:gliding motility-associated C-terminal domain-containing protein [Pseudopedobacter sp.]|uniref:gliding motility-associated C-terminal domain-containing protein n=1 Tax=Pseudopedobacter sp. TaxID=1936787 RepID=UPI0033405A8D